MVSEVSQIMETEVMGRGQLPLEHLDLVVGLRNRKRIGNPAHGGEHMYEMH